MPFAPQPKQPIPLFPLPEFVMLPHSLVPLRLFEPRYVAMGEELIAAGGWLAVSGLKPGWRADYYGAPPFFEIGGLGKVLNHERQEDGQILLFVHALERVRLAEVDSAHPFRLVRAELWADLEGEAESEEGERLLAQLDSLAREAAKRAGFDSEIVDRVLRSSARLPVLADRIAAMIVPSHDERQSLLEERSPLLRGQRVIDFLGGMLLDAHIDEAGGLDQLH